jgi:hypothetical protein
MMLREVFALEHAQRELMKRAQVDPSPTPHVRWNSDAGASGELVFGLYRGDPTRSLPVWYAVIYKAGGQYSYKKASALSITETEGARTMEMHIYDDSGLIHSEP